MRTAQILQKYQKKINLLEAACGSGLVALHLLKKGLVNQVEGFDLDFQAVERSIGNAKKLNCEHQSHFFSGDLFNIQGVLKNLKYSPHLLICNPPWIPIPKGLYTPRIIDGGINGTKFVPPIFKLAQKIGAGMISLNTSSLSFIEKIWEQVRYFKLQLIESIICFNYLGELTGRSEIKKHIKSLKYSFISTHKSSQDFIGTNQDLYLIINLILSSKEISNNPISSNQFYELLKNFQKYGLQISKIYYKDQRLHFYYFTGNFLKVK
ncbi:methyltransferase [Patescibacteria group bacterium]|nr:methyltransferase [Patescibacteria group bacterium]